MGATSDGTEGRSAGGGHTGSERPIRVAVIGCGKIGTRGHLPALARAGRAGLCTLVGVCDVDRRRAEAAARPYGVPAFASAGALLARLRPEVVSIATLPPTHHALVLQALDAGCHVLCEKPVAMHAGEAAEMVAAAEPAGRLLSICLECHPTAAEGTRHAPGRRRGCNDRGPATRPEHEKAYRGEAASRAALMAAMKAGGCVLAG